MTLGEYIANYRAEHKESLRSFSRRAELSPTYVSYLEKGETQRGNKPAASIDTYKAVSKAVGISLDELIRIVDDEISISKEVVETLQFFTKEKISPARQKLLDAVEDMDDEQIEKLLLIIEAAKKI